MTPAEYEKRIADLGFENGTAWAAYTGIDRATYYRHIREDRIPTTLQLIVEMLEKLPVCNPNYSRFYVWPDGDVWLAEEYDQVEDIERDKSDDFAAVFARDAEHAVKLINKPRS